MKAWLKACKAACGHLYPVSTEFLRLQSQTPATPFRKPTMATVSAELADFGSKKPSFMEPNRKKELADKIATFSIKEHRAGTRNIVFVVGNHDSVVIYVE